jgi:hypothetical protein
VLVVGLWGVEICCCIPPKPIKIPKRYRRNIWSLSGEDLNLVFEATFRSYNGRMIIRNSKYGPAILELDKTGFWFRKQTDEEVNKNLYYNNPTDPGQFSLERLKTEQCLKYCYDNSEYANAFIDLCLRRQEELFLKYYDNSKPYFFPSPCDESSCSFQGEDLAINREEFLQCSFDVLSNMLLKTTYNEEDKNILQGYKDFVEELLNIQDYNFKVPIELRFLYFLTPESYDNVFRYPGVMDVGDPICFISMDGKERRFNKNYRSNSFGFLRCLLSPYDLSEKKVCLDSKVLEEIINYFYSNNLPGEIIADIFDIVGIDNVFDRVYIEEGVNDSSNELIEEVNGSGFGGIKAFCSIQ